MKYLAQSGDGVEFLSVILVVVHQSKAGRSSTTELGFQSVHHTAHFLCFELLRQLSLELVLRDIGSLGMQDFEDLQGWH